MAIYDTDARKRIDATVNRVEQTPDSIVGVDPYDRAAPSQRPAQFENGSGETIPAFGCMKLTPAGGIYDMGPGVPFFTADKPGSTLLTDRFAINGPRPVEDGLKGECYLSGQVRALYNTGSPSAGDAYGPTPGQWYLTINYPPIFRTSVISNATDKHVYGELHPIMLLRGELKDAMPSSGSVLAGQSATAYFLDEAGDIVTEVEFEVTDVFGRWRGRAYVSSELRGSPFYAEFAPDTGEWEIVDMHPHALRISGTASANVYYDDTQLTLSGTPVVMSPSGGLVMTALTTANLIKNPLDLQFASGDTVHAEWNEKSATPQWEAVDVGRPRPHRISGSAGANVYYDDTQFTLSGSPIIMNPIDAISEEDYTVANLIKNPLGLQFASGDTVHAEWNEKSTTPQWEAVDVGRPRPHRISGEPTTDVYYDDTEFTLSATPEIVGPIDAISEEDYTVSNLIKNPRGFQFSSSDTIYAEYNITDTQWEAVGPGRPRPHRLTGTASAAVYYNTTQFTLSGTPDIINPVDAISEEVYTTANLIKNPYFLTFPSGGTVFAEWNDTDSQWEAVGPSVGSNGVINQQAGWLTFTASADFLTGGAITIDTRTYFNGQAPAVDITSILNPDNLTGYDNATGVALINTNVSPPTYTAVSVSPIAQDVITEFAVNTSTLKLEWKDRSISVMPREDESAVQSHQGDDCDA